MIKYRLKCKKSHEFEGWFSDSSTYEKQAKRGLICCPDCGSTKVEKALMAPSVTTRRRDGGDAEPVKQAEGDPKRAEMQAELIELMRKVRKHVQENAEYVGHRFADEARKMHYEESEQRGIYGEASLEEAKDLVEEGIGVLPLPRLPEDAS